MSIFHCFQSHVTSGALKTHRTHLLHSTSFCFEIAGTFVSLSLRHKFRDHMPHIQSKVHDLPLFGCKYCREKWSSTSPTSHPRKAENKRASHKKKSISESISIYKSYLKKHLSIPNYPQLHRSLTWSPSTSLLSRHTGVLQLLGSGGRSPDLQVSNMGKTP